MCTQWVLLDRFVKQKPESNMKPSYSNSVALYEQTVFACIDIQGPSKTDNKDSFK